MAQGGAMITRKYLTDYGYKEEDLFVISKKLHDNGLLNPKAHIKKNLTWEDYKTTKNWALTTGAGVKTVYVKFKIKGDYQTNSNQGNELEAEETNNDDEELIKKERNFKKHLLNNQLVEDEDELENDEVEKTEEMAISKPKIFRDLPPLDLLFTSKSKPTAGDIKSNAEIIKDTLLNFGIEVDMGEVRVGPTVTQYSLKPAKGIKLSRITALNNDLALALSAHPIRIEAPIPGKSLVGIEIPNTLKSIVGLGSLVSDEQFTRSALPLLVSLGRDIAGRSQYANLARMPHLLIAGATGSGKSVTIHAIVTSLLFRNPPENLKFIMIDPKRVELTMYNNIPHLLTPVIPDPKKAILALKWVAKEMERRYDILEKSSARDIDSYHQNTKDDKSIPFIVIIIDELADLMQSYPRELEAAVVRLAQMSRAVGIHLILSTQRPSVNIITGLIKANIPARIALQVSSQIDSRTILDAAGAEKLLGAGDMLFLSGEMSKPRRIQAPLISETEVKRVVAHIVRGSEGVLNSEIDFSESKIGNGTDAIFSSMIGDDEEDDELYGAAKQTVIEAGKASTSYLQRKLGVGYARAARLMDILEERGIIGPADGAKPREIIGGGNADDLANEPEDGPEEERV